MLSPPKSLASPPATLSSHATDAGGNNGGAIATARQPDAPERGARAVLLLADLHLSPAIPRTVAAFERFLDSVRADEVEQVFILGDLFEFWIGDDMLALPFVAALVAKMAQLQQRGVKLSVMHGNRDFLLGKRFARAACATLIPDPFILDIFGQRWILTHGDALCTDDHKYQRFRKIARKRWLQTFFLRWPIRWRMRLAGNMRATSEQQGRSRMQISDVSPDAVRALFEHHALRQMIQGHTHRPARHDEAQNVRWVLPDWELDAQGAGQQARGGYLKIEEAGITCISVVPADASAIQAD